MHPPLPDNAAKLQHGHVVSDLHLFTHRSDAADYVRAISSAANGADFLVLNGDIVDFHWTTLQSLNDTAHAAVDWLASFILASPNCQFFYVMGNHDRFDFFADHLQALAGLAINFHWHPTHVRIGRCLFLHGDLALDAGCDDPFNEGVWPAEPMRGRASHLGYRAIVAARAHRVTHPLYPPRRCARRIVKCLRDQHPQLTRGLTDVYFGHTHRTFANFAYRGIHFHNTGATVRHMHCRLLPVEA
ncbi:MAG: metallophosphoesterase family protein [Planctomycetota bacterium]|jgi:UDP-2,3-diacylglucosamine hydrolase